MLESYDLTISPDINWGTIAQMFFDKFLGGSFHRHFGPNFQRKICDISGLFNTFTHKIAR